MSEPHCTSWTGPQHLRPHLVPADWKGHGSVQILPSIKHWLPVPEDLGLKVLDHVLHYFPETEREFKKMSMKSRRRHRLASV